MSALDDFSDSYDPLDDDEGLVECRHCGEDELYWGHCPSTGAWVLLDMDHVPHVCPQHQPVGPGEFSDLTKELKP